MQLRPLIIFLLFTICASAKSHETLRPIPKVQQIYKGTRLNTNVFPWVAYIEADGLGNCTGSLIQTNVVLTAAHCVLDEKTSSLIEPSKIRVTLNSSNVFDENAEGGERHKVEEVIPHYMYKPFSYDNDLALLILDNPSSYSPISLIRPSSSADEPDPIYLAKAMGYGRTETGEKSAALRATDLEIKSSLNCLGKGFPEKNLENYICTIGKDTNIDSGDSGGPLIVYDEGKWLLAGITSMGYNNSTSEYIKYATFTQVKNFYPWIFMSMIMHNPESVGFVKKVDSEKKVNNAFVLGQLSVIQTPETYNLVEKSNVETMLTQAIEEVISNADQNELLSATRYLAQQEVISNPSQFGIATLDNPQPLIQEGVAQVLKNPETFGLMKPQALEPALSESENNWKQIGVRQPITNLEVFNRANIEIVWSYQDGAWKYFTNDPSKDTALADKFKTFTAIPGDSGIWVKFRKN